MSASTTAGPSPWPWPRRGVQTTGITVQNEALEDYYLNLTGGGRHA